MSKIKLEDLRYIGPDKQEEVVEDEIQESVTEDTIDDNDVSEILAEYIEPKEDSKDEKSDKKSEAIPENNQKSVIIKVNKLQIYPKPTTTVPARCFTGNVEVIGKVDRFTIVKYVRPGFGPVKGYTLGI